MEKTILIKKHKYNLFSVFYLVGTGEIVLLLIFTLISSLTPFLSYWGLGKIVDKIKSIKTYNTNFIYTLVLIIGIFLVTGDTFEAIRWAYSTFLEGKIYLSLKKHLLDKISRHQFLDIFEDYKIADSFNLANKIIPSFNNFITSFVMVFSGILGSLPFFYIGIITKWWVPLLLLIGFLPSIYIKYTLEEKLWAFEIREQEEYKEAMILEDVILGKEYAKEIKLYNRSKYFLKKWYDKSFKLLKKNIKIKNKTIIQTVAGSLFEGLIDSFVVYYLFLLIKQNKLSIGNFVFSITTILHLRHNVYYVLLFGVDIKMMFKKLTPYFKVLDYRGENNLNKKYNLKKILDKQNIQINKYKSKNANYKNLIYENENYEIVFENVYFRYPQSENFVLKNINLKIKNKEKIAIVGLNGAGKTTLIKLICGFYLPSNGNYFFRGKNIEKIQIENLRENFTAVFQDFAKFPLTLRENLLLDDVKNKDDLIIKYGKRLRFDLDNKLDLRLNKKFRNSIELSTGQLQKLALIRSLLFDRDIIILDEPTSLLDPQIEYTILNSMIDMMKNKTAIIVTHRLSLCTKVDRIIVIHNGEVVEMGTHNELIKLNKIYSDMFKKQSEFYVNDLNIQ